MARALAWHARGQGFESPYLHYNGNLHYYVYMLYSESIDQFYIGATENLENRIFRHNNSGSKATKKARDWKLFHSEIFKSRSEAINRELEIKRKKSRSYIQSLKREILPENDKKN